MTYQQIPDEATLMQRIAARDQAGLAEFYDLYSPRVYGMSIRILQNTALAVEALQDTFLKIWNQADQWQADRGSVPAWVLTIARFTAIDRLRKEKRHAPLSAVDLDNILEIMGQPSAVNKPGWFDAEILRDMLRELPAEQIEAINLAFFEGMTHAEIAQYLNQPLGTVKSRIRQGLLTLRGLWLQAEQ
jgi:RNA polymerase sigma-70 factor (ECF subfamily)